MQTIKLEKALYWVVRIGAYALPFTLLIVADSMFFPFISGKNFAFRIIVEIMLTAWAGLLIINFKKYWPRWNFLSIALAVFVAAAFISAVFGVNFSQSFWSNFERMDGVITQLHLLALFLVLAGVFRTRHEWFSLFTVSIAVSLLVAFYGFLEYFGKIYFGQDLHSRIISTLGNPLYVAAYLSFHIFLIIYFLTELKNKPLKSFLGVILFAELAAILITQGRGAFVGLVAGTGIMLLGFIFTAPSPKKRAVSIFLMTALVLTLILLNVFKDTEFIRSHGLFSRFADITLRSGHFRFVIWDMAFEAFKERPVLGWGSDNFIVPFAKHYDVRMFGAEPWYDRTHNMPLEWLVAGGLVGFSAYILLFAAVIWAIFRAVSAGIFQKKQAFIFMGMLTAYLVQLLFVFDTLGTYMMFIFFAGFFFAASSYPEEWRNKNKGKTFYSYQISGMRLSVLAGVFIASILVFYFVSARPFMANRALMEALNYFNQGQIDKSYESFQKALKLSKGTIGETETTEHLAFNVYNLFSKPELLRSQEGENFYRLTKNRLEEEIVKSSYPNIKHYILLAQLYHQKAVFDGDAAALQKAFENYEKVILDAAPNYISVYPIYANLLAQTGNINGAIMLTEKAAKILESAGKYDSRIFYSVPFFYTAARRYDDAYRALAAIASKYGNSPNEVLDKEMMKNIITTTTSHGRDAIPFLEKVSALDKNLALAPLMLAQIHALFKEEEQARFYALEALKRDPSLQNKVDEFLKALDR